MVGIIDYGTYVPNWRLAHADVAAVLGGHAGRGQRSVAAFDEDSTTLGVESARWIRSASHPPRGVVFATAHPAYAEKTNATAIHAALGLDGSAAAYDIAGSARCGAAALRAGLDAAAAGRPTLAVLADVRTGLPGGADEVGGGDGAASFLLGGTDTVADLIGSGSATSEFLERWRLPSEATAHVWEERFAEGVYPPLVRRAVTAALEEAGLELSQIDHLVVTGLHDRAVSRVPAVLGYAGALRGGAVNAAIGNTGCAHLGVLLADALDNAAAGETILAVLLADGADAFAFRATDLAAGPRRRGTVLASLNDARPVSYGTFLTWREMLRREPARRPEHERPAAPPAFRNEGWKFAFVGSRCEKCETRHLPAGRVCLSCGAVDAMVSEPLSEVPGTVATFTTDFLSPSLNPPVVIAAIDFDGGGRIQCEMTDVDADSIALGDRVDMTFRRLFTAAGVHNYFWKARPRRAANGEVAR